MDKLLYKEKAFVGISFFFLTYSIFPLFADLTNIPIYIPAILVVVSLALFYPSSFNRGSIKCFFVYLFFLIFYVLLGRLIFIDGLNPTLSPWYRIIIESAWILPNILICETTITINKPIVYKILGYGSVCMLVASILYILPMVISYANYLREDVTEVMARYKPVGLPGYDLMHAYAFMILPLSVLARNTKHKTKIVFLSVLLIFCYMVTQTAVTTSLFVLFMSVIFVFTYNPNNKLGYLIVVGLLLFLLVISYYSGAALAFIDWMMPFFDGTAVSYKLQDLHDSIMHGVITGDSITGRMNYHQISKDAFWENPIFGTQIAGGHSKILDMLGSMGLVVFMPFILIIKSTFDSYRQLIVNKTLRGFLFASYFVSFIFLYEKGIFGNPGWLFMTVIVPCILMAQIRNEHN